MNHAITQSTIAPRRAEQCMHISADPCIDFKMKYTKQTSFMTTVCKMHADYYNCCALPATF